LAFVDPASAAEWVAQMSDPKSKSEAAEKVFRLWRMDDPAAARDWIGKVDGLSDRSRERFLSAFR
jgi:gamma-glutamylcysteine synthetase